MRAPRQKLCFVLVFSTFLLFLPAQLHAYYDDFHYGLTYYIARALGYTPQQAHRIASADVSIDYDEETEPVQDEWQLRWLSSRAGSAGLSYGDKNYAARAQQPRIDFHAFMDCLNVSSCLTDGAATAVIPQKRAQLEARARESGNPGSLLHFVQDQVPHAGYPSDNGHWTAMDASGLNSTSLPLGATTDFVSYSGASGIQGPMIRNRPGVADTVEILTAAMRGTFRGRPIHQKPRSYNWSRDIAPAFQAIVEANSAPAQTAMQAWDQVNDLENPLYIRAWEFYSVWKSESSPVLERALGAVNHMLRSALKANEQIPGSWIVYNLNEQGVPAENDRDNWVLWGDLNIRLDIRKQGEEIAKSYKPAKIEIRLAPTYQGAKEEKIAQGSVQTTEGVTIENLPVGELIVEMRYEDNAPVVQKVNLLRQKQAVSFALDLDKEEKKDKSIDGLLALLERLKELEKKSNESAANAETVLADLQKKLAATDGAIGLVISELSLWMDKLAGLKSQIAAFEAALSGREALIQKASKGKQKAADAEAAAGNLECPPESAIAEGSEEDREIHIQNAQAAAQNIQPLAAAAESGAVEARAAADEFAKLQAEGERLASEIQAVNTAVLFKKLTAASDAHSLAQGQLDNLITVVAGLESFKNEADEIMDAARKMIHELGENKDLHSKLDELSSQFAALYKNIATNYEKWKDIPVENRKKADEFAAQIKELEGRIQAFSAEIAGLAVPSVDAGTVIADAQAAETAAAGVKNATQKAAECPDKIAAVLLKPQDKITNLEIELEVGALRDDGTAEYAVNAVVTLAAGGKVMVLCEGSHNAGHENGAAGGLDNFQPETFRNPLARGDFKPGDSVTVSCYIADHPETKIFKTVAIAGNVPLDPKEQLKQKDCSGIQGSVPRWNEAARSVYCGCVQGQQMNAAQTACEPDDETLQKTAQPITCPYPNTEQAWFREEKMFKCVCKAGFDWDKTGYACVEPRLREVDCRHVKGATPYWDEAQQAGMCACSPGHVIENNICVPSHETQVAQTDCSHIAGTTAYWDEGKQSPMCGCPAGQIIVDNTCTPQQQSAQVDCSAYPGTVAMWDNSINNYRCNCPAGSEWNGSSCMQPNWGQVLGGLTNTYNRGTGSGTPYGNSNGSWNPNAGTGYTPTGQLPGLGSSGGSSGGGTYAGFVNQGYQAPSSSSSGNSGPSSGGVDTSAGNPCVTAFGQSDDC